jgi:probable rRNA maturation factor
MSRGAGPRVRVVRRRRGGVRLAAAELQSLVERALRACDAPRHGEATVTLVDDRAIARLNATHMGERGATDVLSFPLLEPTAYPARSGTARRAAHPSLTLSRHRGVRAAVDAPVALGDILISVDRALVQAREGRGGPDGRTSWSAADEVRLLAVHGALHLCGWDHRTPTARREMFALQERILRAHARARSRNRRATRTSAAA